MLTAIPTCLTYYVFRESAEINRNLQKIARIKRHEFEEGSMRKERGSCGRPPGDCPSNFFTQKKWNKLKTRRKKTTTCDAQVWNQFSVNFLPKFQDCRIFFANMICYKWKISVLAKTPIFLQKILRVDILSCKLEAFDILHRTTWWPLQNNYKTLFCNSDTGQ